jgi:hypothetical protein
VRVFVGAHAWGGSCVGVNVCVCLRKYFASTYTHNACLWRMSASEPACCTNNNELRNYRYQKFPAILTKLSEGTGGTRFSAFVNPATGSIQIKELPPTKHSVGSSVRMNTTW